MKISYRQLIIQSNQVLTLWWYNNQSELETKSIFVDNSTNIHFMGVERLNKNSRNHVLRMYVTFKLHIFILNVDYTRPQVN